MGPDYPHNTPKLAFLEELHLPLHLKEELQVAGDPSSLGSGN